MQDEQDTQESTQPASVPARFGQRVREFREQAELTQQQLSSQLKTDFGIKLDTSAITRIENGSREPRLGEAIALSEVLKFGLYGLSPTGGRRTTDLLDYRTLAMGKLVDECREKMLKLLASVDRVAEAYQLEPYEKAGWPPLPEVIREEIQSFKSGIDQGIEKHLAGITHPARTLDDASVKRELIESLGYRIIQDAPEA